jgi:hypothetical protein
MQTQAPSTGRGSLLQSRLEAVTIFRTCSLDIDEARVRIELHRVARCCDVTDGASSYCSSAHGTYLVFFVDSTASLSLMCLANSFAIAESLVWKTRSALVQVISKYARWSI